MGHLRKIYSVLAFSTLIVLVPVGLPAAPFAASARASASGVLVQDAEVNASGCPTGEGVALGPEEHCVPWPVQFDLQTSTGPGNSCGEALFMLVPLNAGADEYLALWSWDTPAARANPWLFRGPGSGPYGEEAWSTTALTPQNTGVNVHYEVPSGFGAWFVAAGGGPGPCKTQTGVAQGWAVTYKWEVSGQVTYSGTGDPVPGVTVRADCPSGGATTTDKDGDYRFLLDKGPCTIVPEPPAGENVDPENRVLDVAGNIDHVDFQVTGVLYFKVEKGLSVTTRAANGAALVKAGTNFTERVILKDVSKTKSVLVAPIYPTLSGNADGGQLQAVGGVVQRQISSLTTAHPSPIVYLKPGDEQVFDSVIYTVASRYLGTDNGGQKVSGGTRAYVQFAVPHAFILSKDDDVTSLDPKLIEVAPGSTDKISVSINDSAPDQTPFNGYLATYDISKALLVGIYHFTAGLVHGIFWDLPILLAKGVLAIPTALIHYVDLETQLWQEAKDNPAEMAQFLDVTDNTVLLIYKQAPFLLKKLGDIKAGLDTAVYNHFNDIENDWRLGDWEKAVDEWTDDSVQFLGNTVGTLFINPAAIAGAIGDSVLARTPGLLKAVYVADEANAAADARVIEAAVDTGKAADTVPQVEFTMKTLVPGIPLIASEMEKLYGISQQMFDELAAFCEKYDVLVTLRSRASEAIDLINQGLAVVKPAAIKLKTVSQMDIKFLGYPKDVVVAGKEVSSIGQVVVREPLFLTPDCLAACALQKFQAYIVREGIKVDEPAYYELQSRWAQRYGEWTNPHEGYVRTLTEDAGNKKLTLDKHWQENMIDPKLPQPAQTVGFRMSEGPKVSTPGEDYVVTSYVPELCAGTLSIACDGGVWKSVTGDVDLVSVTAADGSPLSDKAYVHLLEALGATSVDIQHPATATWYSLLNDGTIVFDANHPGFADKAKYMQANQCCVMQVAPDGQARAVMLDLNGSNFVDKNNYYLNYQGGYMNPAP